MRHNCESTEAYFLKIQNIFTLCLCWPYLRVLNPCPRCLEFYNLGRGFHEYHDHTFRLSQVLIGLKNIRLLMNDVVRRRTNSNGNGSGDLKCGRVSTLQHYLL